MYFFQGVLTQLEEEATEIVSKQKKIEVCTLHVQWNLSNQDTIEPD